MMHTHPNVASRSKLVLRDVMDRCKEKNREHEVLFDFKKNELYLLHTNKHRIIDESQKK